MYTGMHLAGSFCFILFWASFAVDPRLTLNTLCIPIWPWSTPSWLWTHCIHQAGPELGIFPVPLSLECWNYSVCCSVELDYTLKEKNLEFGGWKCKLTGTHSPGFNCSMTNNTQIKREKILEFLLWISGVVCLRYHWDVLKDCLISRKQT